MHRLRLCRALRPCFGECGSVEPSPDGGERLVVFRREPGGACADLFRQNRCAGENPGGDLCSSRRSKHAGKATNGGHDPQQIASRGWRPGSRASVWRRTGELALQLELCLPRLLLSPAPERARSTDFGLSAGILAAGPEHEPTPSLIAETRLRLGEWRRVLKRPPRGSTACR